MSQSIVSWLNRPDISRLKKMNEEQNMKDLFGKHFFRDPTRNVYFDSDTFYSPADGVVLYTCGRIDSKDDILDVKGIKLSLKELLHDDDFSLPSLVIGVFMTYLDVHVNRTPINSYFLDERQTPFLFTHNISMELLETELLKDLNYNPAAAKYLFHNERRVLKFYSPRTNDFYYIVQVADREVGVILNWNIGDFVHQGERFGMVRWGSQVDLIIPLSDRNDYKIMVTPLDHVEGGLDSVVHVV